MNSTRRPRPQPLHRQLRDLLMARIDGGEWSPGTYLPAESDLAEAYGVAVGTLRKALLELAGEGIVERRRGKGTVVATHESDAVLFRFLNLFRADGSRVRPASRLLSRRRRPALAEECADLALAPGAEVVEIRRVREADETPVIVEEITLAADRFGALETRPEGLPNTLYHLYEAEFGARVHRAEEQITAAAADRDTAARLGFSPGAPLLRILRRAVDWGGQPVERRLSLVATARLAYRAEL